MFKEVISNLEKSCKNRAKNFQYPSLKFLEMLIFCHIYLLSVSSPYLSSIYPLSIIFLIIYL